MDHPQTPRVDQRVVLPAPAAPGSRSGSGELAGALGFPGVPSAVPNCQGASIFQAGVGINTMLVFPAAGRIWSLVLTYVVTSNNSFTLATARTVAAVQTKISALTLAAVQLGVANNNQHAEGTCPISFPGLPVQQGEKVTLSVNNGNVISNLDQQATVAMLYSIP